MAQTTPSALPPTQAQLQTEYIDLIKSKNPLINANLDPVIQVQSNVYGGALSGVYANIYLYGQQIYPISSAGRYLSNQLASWALLPISAGAYALGSCELTEIQPADLSIPANTQLQDSNGNIFIIPVAVEIAAGDLGVIPFRSNVIGAGFQLAPTTILYLATPINEVSELEVTNMNDGAGPETPSSAQDRLLNTTQNPPLGGNKTDYFNWALESSTSITGATVNNYIDPVTKDTHVNVFVLGGQLNIISLLANPSLQYSRYVSPDVVTTCDNYIESQRPVTDIVTVASVETYTVTETITVQVKLVAGYTLTTIDKGTGLTVQQLIVQETRRPIILTSQQPTLIGSTYYIPRDSISQSILNSLNGNPLTPGTIAQIVQNLTVILTDVNGIAVPDPTTTPQIIYDLPPNQPNVTVVSV